ncbi:MAG: MFS transporter [Rhodospirillaceae bacterium]|jgi:MFS family permease|nr:MFS transporter [Rhodospirillaceae bacterium]MBT5664464.1 MFS transporter [Rhodospirillaceae bacterium]MBT5809838.1 MFS transporter [Rhodospirillaceae bacterium]
MTDDVLATPRTGLRRPDPVRKNVILLAVCQALANSGSSLIVAVSALVGLWLAEDKSFATLPIAVQFAATMLSTLPASFLMRRIGRRAGFTVGQCFGLVGMAVCAYAIYRTSFSGFIAGCVLVGIHNAFWQYYRFAAADTASEAYRSRAISYVLAGGVIAAFVGPGLAVLSLDMFESVRYAGNYVAVMGLILAAITVLQFIDIPRDRSVVRRGDTRALLEIARQPAFVVAVMAAVIGYTVMTLVMTATPLAMKAHGHGFNETAFVIHWHLLGMFAPSFVTGHIIARLGSLRVIAAGVFLMIICIVINLAGVEAINFRVSLVLLGVGWNFMFVGGTNLLTNTYSVAERTKVQGVNDFMVFTFVAMGTFSSGFIQHVFGWSWVNLGVLPPLLLVLVGVAWLALWERRAR